ncbi:NAD(P)-dependent dehydrogenase, short-chain alcohol dehydrogenase family [Xaviernesmea oryzae]|uniref:NAD(P)-dependent dehydrogenase, short-chain alcohol dehydrogenase family n=1 Tax=Xaviernesmea oryzae TaxID=464029 RepID=A0A1X7E0S0_9HYPH|nr:SDR family oxidoreductase [Xaviernesmea oryzae]SMF24900.1 NAD(P)-dependent dehydrogenase, short-chain alcohol dehydrogenase family [Xaviernesmea oryzae]
MRLLGKRVLVVGGTSGIGLGAASAAAAQGAIVTIASRSPGKIKAAITQLEDAGGAIVDTSDNAAIEKFFRTRKPFDHVVVSAAQTKVAPIQELSLADAYASMESKFWGAYRIARAANITKGGSLTLVSGFLAIRPRKGTAILAAINAGLEGLTKGLALEMAPVRVNAVSPGLVMTPMYDGMSGDSRKTMFDNAADKLPVNLVGLPEHIAVQITAFQLNPYITGSIVYVDGGGALI